MAPVLSALQESSLQKTLLSVPIVQLELSLQPVDPHHALSAPLEHTLPLAPLPVKLALLDITHPEVQRVAPHALLVHMSRMIIAILALQDHTMTLLLPHHVNHVLQEHTPLNLTPLHANHAKLDITILSIMPHHALPALPETSLALLVPQHVVHAFQERTPLNLPPLDASHAKLISTLLYIIPYPAINVLLSALLQLLRALTVPSVLLVILNCLSIAIFVLQDHTLPLIPLSVFHALLDRYQQPVANIAMQHAPTAII